MTAPTGLPCPWQQPTMTVPAAGLAAFGFSRARAYAAAERGDLPVLRVGERLFVPTARLYEALGLPLPPNGAAPLTSAP